MNTLSWCWLCFSDFFFLTLYMKADNSMVQMLLSQGEYIGAFLPVKQYDLQEFQS